MPAPRPQSGDDEATIQILTVEPMRDLGGFSVGFLGALESPLLLVGKEGTEDAADHETGEYEVGEGP